MGKLTVIVLTRETSEKLSDCLESVSNLADELIVLIDTDKKITESEKIAKKFNAKIIKHINNNDFATHRNLVLKYVESEWLFYIDDDERVTPELKRALREISHRVRDDNVVAFAIPRRNFIFGKEFKHSGQWPSYVIRLFRKSNLKGWKGELHEQPDFEGKLVHLNEPLIHLKHDELSSMVEKTNDWSEIEAKLMFEANHPKMNIFRFITAMWRELWLRMIMQKAFLDGPEGIIYAIYQVFSRFISYAKLWEMQLNNEKTP